MRAYSQPSASLVIHHRHPLPGTAVDDPGIPSPQTAKRTTKALFR